MCAKTSDLISRSATASDDRVKHELRDLARMLREAALDVAWRQWRALGASAALKSRSARHLQSLIDPEALVLFSLVFIENERRLAGLVRDWVVLNADLLSVQRIKNLAKDYGKTIEPDLTSRLESLATIAVESGKDFRWRSLTKWSGGQRNTEHGSVHGNAFTPRYSRSARGAGGSKTRAVRAPLADPSALLLRLRLGLGVGVKADVLGYLLGKGEDRVTVRRIAEATAYSTVAVRRAVDDLAAAGFIQALDAQPAGYRAERQRWADFLKVPATPAVWLYWHQRFVFVSAFVAWADAVENRPLSAYAFGAHGRELMEHHRRAFEHDAIPLLMRHPNVTDWVPYVRDAVQQLASSMEKWA